LEGWGNSRYTTGARWVKIADICKERQWRGFFGLCLSSAAKT
jgi:hypothetical protein